MFYPNTRPNETLFVEYKHRSFNADILTNVVPRINGQFYTANAEFSISRYAERYGLTLPIKTVTLTSSSDDIDIHWVFKRFEITFSVCFDLTFEFFQITVSQSCTRLADTWKPAQDLTVTHFFDRLQLMRSKFDSH